MVTGHGVGVSQSFLPGTHVQSIREKAADFPLLGFLLPLLHSSHRRGLEQQGSRLVLTTLCPPPGPHTRIPRTAGLKYGESPRALLGLCRCRHRALSPPWHDPARKKGCSGAVSVPRMRMKAVPWKCLLLLPPPRAAWPSGLLIPLLAHR